MDWQTLAVAGVAALGGLMRGLTGFGGAMVMAPILSMAYPPARVVPVVMLLEAFIAAPMLWPAWKRAQRGLVLTICAAAVAALPAGAFVLLHAPAQLLRRGIAGIVMALSLMLLGGVRYRGPRPLPLTVAIAAGCGVLLGATGIGGPPMVVYLLSGPEPIDVTRANMTVYASVIAVAALSLLWLHGALQLGGALTPWLMAPSYGLGIALGTHLHGRTREQALRRVAVLMLIAVCAVALLRG